MFTAAYAANATPGGQTDPLVTLSYLNGTYTRQVKDLVDQTVTARKAEMEQAPRTSTFTVADAAVIQRGAMVTMYRWFWLSAAPVPKTPPEVVSMRPTLSDAPQVAEPTRSITSHPTSRGILPLSG
mgnify:CR=1 FL=1